jgi:hypothetical protein
MSKKWLTPVADAATFEAPSAGICREGTLSMRRRWLFAERLSKR